MLFDLLELELSFEEQLLRRVVVMEAECAVGKRDSRRLVVLREAYEAKLGEVRDCGQKWAD